MKIFLWIKKKTGRFELKTGLFELKTGRFELKTGRFELKTGLKKIILNVSELFFYFIFNKNIF